ncbi:ABC transporter permease, partial [Roseateles sp. GG27B]
MFIFKLLLKNAFRHKLRTALTLFGLVVALAAFGLLRTIVGAWYAGVEGSSSTRLVT